MPLSAHEILFQDKDPTLYSGLSRLSQVGTVDELLGALRLPAASTTSPHCFRKNTDPINMNEQNLIIFGQDQEGSILPRGVQLNHLCKHASVSGVPGSGKTTAMLNLSLQLHQHGIPFLAIEPVKTEYRILKTFRNHSDSNARSLAERLEIYSPGDETVSPLRFNPLELLPGISVYEHIDNVLTCFKAAIPMEGSLPALLGEALEQVYEDHPDREHPPVMADLVAAAERVLARKGYAPDTNSDFRAAIEARLGVLTRRSVGEIFQCLHSIPQINHLMDVPAIIEFNRLHEEQACLPILLLLTAIREHLKTAPISKKDPGYVIIIEEAHNIVGRTGPATASSDVADPKAFASDYVVRMLAELRALGVGIIIVDQLPSAVAPEVIKNTTTKLAFRQPDKEDREVLGASMLLSPTETEDIARLNTGEAFIYTESYHKSRRIQTENLHEAFDFNIPIRNERIIPYIRDDAWYQEAALERISDELTLLREKMDAFEDERIPIIQGFKNVLGNYEQVLVQRDSDAKSRKVGDLKLKAQELRKHLSHAYKSFVRNSYRRYLSSDMAIELNDTATAELRDDLMNRFESVIDPGVKKTLELMRDFINQRDTQKG